MEIAREPLYLGTWLSLCRPTGQNWANSFGEWFHCQNIVWQKMFWKFYNSESSHALLFSLSLVDQHAELFKVFTKNKRWQLQKLNKSGPVFDLRDISATTLVANMGRDLNKFHSLPWICWSQTAHSTLLVNMLWMGDISDSSGSLGMDEMPWILWKW